jgi:hypothetical protein
MTIARTFLAAALAVASWAAPAGAADWRNMSVSQFPAQVRSISFDGGHVLDRNRSLTWGAWTVGFGPQAPVATGASFPDGSLSVIAIEKLKCTNRVVGESECKMTLWLPRNVNVPCSIWGDKDSNVPKINIDCPIDLKIE